MISGAITEAIVGVLFIGKFWHLQSSAVFGGHRVIVTKHCKPADRERMLRGHFKIGSHSEYSGAETSGLLSDNSEGRGATQVVGDVKFSGRIGGAEFVDCVSIGAGGAALHIEEQINTAIFCSSAGKYKAARHHLNQYGSADDGYPPNDDVTTYLTLDAERLRDALQLATDEIFGIETRWLYRPVIYQDRIRRIPIKRPGQTSSFTMDGRLLEQAFTKPTIYKCEEEFRFVMKPVAGVEIPSRIFTQHLSTSVQDAFRIAIANS